MLQNVIKVLSKRIEDYRKKNDNEASTKSGLIQPLFKEIGWDFTDIDSVEPEFSVLLEGENNPADYALKFEGKACLFLEAKRINEKIDIAIKDGAEKSIKENVPWLIATNGDDKLDQDVLNKIMEKIINIFGDSITWGACDNEFRNRITCPNPSATLPMPLRKASRKRFKMLSCSSSAWYSASISCPSFGLTSHDEE